MCGTLNENAKKKNFKEVVEQTEDCLVRNLLHCGVLALLDPLGQDLIN